MAIIDADEKPVSCEFFGCNGNVAPYLIGATTNIQALEQEPFKPMIEIDLYSVIKQAYIEREALDKIKAEIDYQQKWLLHAGYTIHNVDIALDTIKSVVAEIKESKKCQ